ncbi:Immunoglobulin domain [Popillia japonica]|uniref:Immunoglobulin domain n=1 Tax=Popillia japonica TaxID=7064 RepID=A0AAW1N0X2_POPJA
MLIYIFLYFRHVGDAAIKCDCTTGFSGETCNSREETTIKNVCDDCVVTCAADQDVKPSICKCSNKKMNNEMITYFATVQVMKAANMKDEHLRRVAEAQLTKGLREYVTPVQDPKIIHYESFPSFAEATLRFYATRKDEKKIKTAVFAKWKDHGHIGNISLAQEDISFTTDPLISLQSVNINQGGVIREGGDFILSCVARGSPNVSFRWFKDGSFVNVSAASSYKWTRLIEGPNIKDQYTALLGIDKAFVLDQGLFTCQITDQGIQQCLSKHVEVRAPPKVWIEPMSLTVRKPRGDSNVKINEPFTANTSAIAWVFISLMDFPLYVSSEQV